jgi:glutamine amidotransferase-like uncharacterized protein
MVHLGRRSLVAIAAAVLLIAACVAYLDIRPIDKEKGVVTIALYSQNVWQMGLEPMQKMLESFGLSFELIDAEVINSGELENYRILLIPGGDPSTYSYDISPEGKENIRKFVSQGGAYIGICGGSLFAWGSSNLALFDGQVRGSSDWEIQGNCTVMLPEQSHPTTRGAPQSFEIYCTGITIHPNKESSAMVISTYEANSEIAMVAFEYGRGRVFLFGPHPEFDEDDWWIMKNVIRWCLGELESLI